MMPLEVVERMEDEKKARRTKEIEEIDSWLVWLFREHPLLFWLVGIGIGLGLAGFSWLVGAMADYFAR